MINLHSGQNRRTGKGGLVYCLAVFLLLGSLSACEPKDRRPGLWVNGDVVSTPVADWAFSDSVDEIFIETRAWYGLPHSVTTVGVAASSEAFGNVLYVPSIYYDGGNFPEGKVWNQNIAARPDVRLKIGANVYPATASLVTNTVEFARALSALGQKYPFWKEQQLLPKSERITFVIIRMQARSVQ